MIIHATPFPITPADMHLWAAARQLHIDHLDPNAREYPAYDDQLQWKLYTLHQPDQTLTGYATTDTIPGEPTGIYINWLLIHPDHRNQGHGTQLLKTIAQDTHQTGHTHIYLRPLDGPTRTQLTRYYKQHGFHPVTRSGHKYLTAHPTDILTRHA